jgi:hypothetical protein
VALESRWNRFGLYAAALYALVVVSAWVWIGSRSKPEYVGYDWIPLYLLAFPWLKLELADGLISNAGLFYLLGALVGLLLDLVRPRRKQ